MTNCEIISIQDISKFTTVESIKTEILKTKNLFPNNIYTLIQGPNRLEAYPILSEIDLEELKKHLRSLGRINITLAFTVLSLVNGNLRVAAPMEEQKYNLIKPSNSSTIIDPKLDLSVSTISKSIVQGDFKIISIEGCKDGDTVNAKSYLNKT